ncbi:probable cytochrome P450 6a13 [Epargyreus clarus]|uniref:probable cytochrome P450 6a13 n=1 Tax=Epargyreus clarus TaxID=520877 RepID=UPI003C2FD6F9
MMFVLVIVIVILIYWSKGKYTYWTKRNVKYEPPLPFFGNHLPILCGKQTYPEIYSKLYTQYNEERYVGYYKGKVPELVIRDPELLKHIFSIDFSHFHARGLGRDSKVEPLMLNLFSIDGDSWKLLRHELSPAFTISKIRSMFPVVIQCAEKLQSVADALTQNGEDVDVCNLMARFSIDLIGACGFGIDMNAINTEKSLFVEVGQMIFTKSTWQMLLYALRDMFPDNKFINNIPIARDAIRKTILEIVNIVRDQRRNDASSKHNDFMDLLLKLESKGKMYGQSLKEKDRNGLPKQVEITFDEICLAAQLFIFFAAGFETSSTATSFTLHQLAYHPNIQYEIQAQIDDILKKYDGKLCYDSVSEMSLLEMAFKESMRIFPPGGYTTRICTKEYTLPGTDLILEPGMKVVVPIQAIHMDPKYYNNPTEFRPERFSPDEVKTRHKYVYLPFGEGPRKCIGAHLGLYESLAGLVAILQKFTVEPAPTSRQKHRLKRTSYLVQAVENGLPLKFRLRGNRNESNSL